MIYDNLERNGIDISNCLSIIMINFFSGLNKKYFRQQVGERHIKPINEYASHPPNTLLKNWLCLSPNKKKIIIRGY